MPPPTEIPVRLDLRTPPRVPPAAYNPPAKLTVYRWQAAPQPAIALTPESRRLLDTYQAFSRFPILIANDHVPGGIILTWVDLRFSVPGRAIPFVLQVDLDDNGRLAAWQIGGHHLPKNKPFLKNSRPG